MANGTATGYSTGDAMFKAAAEADVPRRALGSEPHGADLASTPPDSPPRPTPPSPEQVAGRARAKARRIHDADEPSIPPAQWRVADEDEAIDPHEAAPRDDRERPSANEPAEHGA